MEKVIIKPHAMYGTSFGLVDTLSGTYVCPGWHQVPSGTTREQIEFDMHDYVAKYKTPLEVMKTSKIETYQVESSKIGKFYEVKNNNGNWSCNCPAASFHRGDCKHIKKLK
jgi:hypothetical protein